MDFNELLKNLKINNVPMSTDIGGKDTSILQQNPLLRGIGSFAINALPAVMMGESGFGLANGIIGATGSANKARINNSIYNSALYNNLTNQQQAQEVAKQYNPDVKVPFFSDAKQYDNWTKTYLPEYQKGTSATNSAKLTQDMLDGKKIDAGAYGYIDPSALKGIADKVYDRNNTLLDNGDFGQAKDASNTLYPKKIKAPQPIGGKTKNIDLFANPTSNMQQVNSFTPTYGNPNALTGGVDETQYPSLQDRALALQNSPYRYTKALKETLDQNPNFSQDAKVKELTAKEKQIGLPYIAPTAQANIRQKEASANLSNVMAGEQPKRTKIMQQGLEFRGRPPAAVLENITQTQSQIGKIDRALKSITGNPRATGLDRGIMPSSILDRVDPKGVNARADLADLSSIVIKDRSGAAVTAAEFPRLRPFLPQTGDTAATVKKKLTRMKEIIQEEANIYQNTLYNSGYNSNYSNNYQMYSNPNIQWDE